MASEAQMAANRRNALLSTGPKTAAGKEISRANALRHGLAARQLVALGEAGDDLAAYHDALGQALLPQDTYEAALVRRLALLSWRLDRLCRIEAALLETEADGVARGRLGKRRDDIWPFQLPALARYEAALDRAFARTMNLLERRQAARRRDAAAPGASSPAAGGPAPFLILQNEPNLAPAAGAGEVSAPAAS